MAEDNRARKTEKERRVQLFVSAHVETTMRMSESESEIEPDAKRRRKLV